MPIPENETSRIHFCPHCGNETPQRLLFLHEHQLILYDAAGKRNDEDEVGAIYYIAECGTCGDLLLYHSVLGDISDFYQAELIHPSAERLPECVPTTVREAYEEAARIRGLAPNAYAVMLRRALEAVCDDRSVQHGVLQKRLALLAERGELPSTLAEASSILRTLGNAGAHQTRMKVTIPMTWGMAEFFRAIVEYVYIAPDRIEKFRAQLSRQEGAALPKSPCGP